MRSAVPSSWSSARKRSRPARCFALSGLIFQQQRPVKRRHEKEQRLILSDIALQLVDCDDPKPTALQALRDPSIAALWTRTGFCACGDQMLVQAPRSRG